MRSYENEIKLFSAEPTDDTGTTADCDCDCKAPAVPLVLRAQPEDLEPHMEQCDCKSASVTVVYPPQTESASADRSLDLEPIAPFIIKILPLYAN